MNLDFVWRHVCDVHLAQFVALEKIMYCLNAKNVCDTTILQKNRLSRDRTNNIMLFYRMDGGGDHTKI